MNIQTRQPYNPYMGPLFVLTDIGLVLAGITVPFGEECPEFAGLHHTTHHYGNGILGTKEELDSLEGIPVALSNDDVTGPIARFVSHHHEMGEELIQEKIKKEEIDEMGGDVFAIENAKLLKSKRDLVAYAEIFNIELKVATNISMKNMLQTLEQEATKLGLIA
jgi:hypothetical protein